MANPFTAFQFPATGNNQSNRTMPDRIFDIKNVKDFGAKGDGVTDDTAAITAAYAAIPSTAHSFDTDYRGIVYFPAGTFLISSSILFDAFNEGNENVSVFFIGEAGLSSVTGNFSDYLFKASGGFLTNVVFDKLTLTNTNASGGGIRLGGNCTAGAIRNCEITANQGISTYNDNVTADLGSFEIAIENCVLNGSNTSGSRGILLASDGPITNCRVLNYGVGILACISAKAQHITGCYFEHCGSAIQPGVGPDGFSASANDVVIAGCWFKNNSIAIDVSGGALSFSTVSGCYIEGTNGQAPGNTNPLFGILDGASGSSNGSNYTTWRGIVVTGQYDTAAIRIYHQSSFQGSTYTGVNASNSGAGSVWSFPDGNIANMPLFSLCTGTGMPFIYTVAGLPTESEGLQANVSDGTNSLAWGATVTNTGTHTTHYKVRGNGSNWTVMGQ